MNILSTYHPATLAFQSIYDQFPGALNFYLFCYDKGVKTYHCKGKNKVIFLPKEIEESTIKIAVQRFRNKKKELIWGDLDDLPVNHLEPDKEVRIKQLSIQDEIEQNVLIFRIESITDDAFDVFAIQFSKSFSNFYIQSGRNALSSDLKKTIGKTIRNQIVWLYALYKSQKRNIERIQLAYQQNVSYLEQIQIQLNNEREFNQVLLTKYLHQIIAEHEITLKCKITLDRGVLNEIKVAKIGINDIQNILKDAILTAYDLAIDRTNIHLTPNLILVNKNQHNATKNNSHQIIALDRTIALLDRYEKAARQLERKSIRINGRNLATELQISGPAITDAIKKHTPKIKRLLEKYPTKWELICDFVKPIREIKWSTLAAGS